MARLKPIDDSVWLEVFTINNYAMYMGYLLMGVRGLGLLLLTWSTVVLLGGFVSMLKTEDFWSLTVITLVQAAGVCDFFLKEKFMDIRDLVSGIAVALVGMTGNGDVRPTSVPRIIKRYRCVLVVHLLLYALVLCVLGILYVLGLYISAGVSLWRLIKQDYGNTEAGVHLKPALDVLYSLAVVQGVLFIYRAMYASEAKTGLVKQVSMAYGLDSDIVTQYLDETVKGCTKDPSSFGRGRNLVRYAINRLMESESPDRYLTGVCILGTILEPAGTTQERWRTERLTLTKQLMTGSTSFVHMIQKLLETLGPRSPYSRKIREHAARIVVNVAGDIHLEEFPRGIRCICSLLETLEEYNWLPEEYKRDILFIPKEYERDWLVEPYEYTSLWFESLTQRDLLDTCNINQRSNSYQRLGRAPESETNQQLDGYKELVVQGLLILQKLAVDEDNCIVISNTQGLLSKIMGLIPDQHHSPEQHDVWTIFAEESLELINRLIVTGDQTGTELLREISSKREAIVRTLKSILECRKCEVLLKRQAVEILLELCVDTSSMMASNAWKHNSSSTRRIFTWILLHIFLLSDIKCYPKMHGPTQWLKKRSYIRNLAGEKLQAMQSLQSVVGDLRNAIVDSENNSMYRVQAAQVLEHLCRHYSKPGEYLDEVKKLSADVISKVLREIILHVNIKAETDLETGCSSAFHQKNSEQHEDIKLQETLVSLCDCIRGAWTRDRDFARRLDEIAAEICSEQGKPPPPEGITSLVDEAKELLKNKA